MKVALVAHTLDAPDAVPLQVGEALRDRGHEPVVLSSHRHSTSETTEQGVRVVRVARLPEAPLRYRGFTGPLSHAPLMLRALKRGGYDVVHAFTPEDAWIALRSRDAPVVFTAAEPLGRDGLSDRRLRLRAVQAAVEHTDAVTAPTDELAALVARWLAVDAEVIDPRDAAAHLDLYRRVLATRSR